MHFPGQGKGFVKIVTGVDRSLVEQGNGGFLFKPVVKLITSEPGESLDAPVPLIPEAGESDGSEESTPESLEAESENSTPEGVSGGSGGNSGGGNSGDQGGGPNK